MAWDVERTKQLLLSAATAEFSRYGLAGARVDRIAANAGVNKERIYQYFGSKESLFATVLERELTAALDSIVIAGSGPDAIADYAGKAFDYATEHPDLARLTFWEGLEREEPVAESLRRLGGERKVRRLMDAMPELGVDDARDLLLTCLTLADGWPVLTNADRVITGEVRSQSRQGARRAFFVRAMRAIAEDLRTGSARPPV